MSIASPRRPPANAWERLLHAIDSPRQQDFAPALACMPQDAPTNWATLALHRMLSEDRPRMVRALLDRSPELATQESSIVAAAERAAWKSLLVLLDTGCPPPRGQIQLGFKASPTGGLSKQWAEVVVDALGRGVWPHLERWRPDFLQDEQVATRTCEVLLHAGKGTRSPGLDPDLLDKLASLDLPGFWPEYFSEDLGAGSSTVLEKLLARPDPAATMCQLLEHGWIKPERVEAGARGEVAVALRRLLAEGQQRLLEKSTPHAPALRPKTRL